MLERVCKAMHKYSNFNINKIPGSEVEIKRIEAEIDIKRIEAEIEIKKTEAEIKRIEAEVEIKRMNLLDFLFSYKYRSHFELIYFFQMKC